MATERIIEPSCPGGGGPTPPSSPVPVPAPCSLCLGPQLSEARPPPPSGQEDKQGWNRTGQEDGMSPGQSRTGGPCPPSARREGMRATAGSLHPAAPFCASHPLALRSSFPSGESGESAPLPPSCLWVGLQVSCLGVRLMPQKWPLAFRKGQLPLLEFCIHGGWRGCHKKGIRRIKALELHCLTSNPSSTT